MKNRATFDRIVELGLSKDLSCYNNNVVPVSTFDLIGNMNRHPFEMTGCASG